MSNVCFSMLLHSHQPVGNFDHVIEEAYQRAYSPFLGVLSEHEEIHVSLHYSGVLLEWIETRHPEFFRDLRRLIDRGQVEILGGGFYEPILVSIPDSDKTAQVRKLSAYLRNHFGVTPRGAWLAERVWEPTLARPLAEAGVEYIVLDDTHFLAAGLDPEALRGYYLTEEAGASLRVVPSLKSLRYTIPFREPAETLDILRQGRETQSGGAGGPAPLFALGDDCEKFGVWPGTFEHCYQHFWLERFMQALGEAREWLETATISSYLAANPPLGRAYLPAASYPEMMEWALPIAASREFKSCLEECVRTPSSERFHRFLLGGLWRNFMSKYPESNQLHKLMLEVSRRWHEANRAGSTGKLGRRLAEAQDHLLAGQCNDAYWHGVFGGLYAPHLRSGVLRRLIQAEALLDRIESALGKPDVSFESRDFDADGQKEILIGHPAFGMIVRPADGGTVSSLRFKLADVELINSLARRPEVYHEQVRQGTKPSEAPAETPPAGPASIHDRVVSRELNLANFLRYDRYLRHAFRTLIFPAGKTVEDYSALGLEENPELAGGPWELRMRKESPGGAARQVARASGIEQLGFELERQARLSAGGKSLTLSAVKTISTSAPGGRWRLECTCKFTTDAPTPGFTIGLEMVFNLLAPNVPDRYFLARTEAGEVRHPLEFTGEVNARRLLIVDRWQRVRITLDAGATSRWWIAPIETISQSESGFERVYQGSAILAVWPVGPRPVESMPAAFTRALSTEIELLPPPGSR